MRRNIVSLTWDGSIMNLDVVLDGSSVPEMWPLQFLDGGIRMVEYTSPAAQTEPVAAYATPSPSTVDQSAVYLKLLDGRKLELDYRDIGANGILQYATLAELYADIAAHVPDDI